MATGPATLPPAPTASACSSLAWCRSTRARASTASPIAVSCTPRARRRTASCVWRDFSRSVSAADSADCDRCSRSAAPLIVPVSATATNAASWRMVKVGTASGRVMQATVSSGSFSSPAGGCRRCHSTDGTAKARWSRQPPARARRGAQVGAQQRHVPPGIDRARWGRAPVRCPAPPVTRIRRSGRRPCSP